MGGVTAGDVVDAARLYEAGADYVLVPHSVGGEYLATLIEHYGKGEGIREKLKSVVANLGKA